ncbi:hypothetical protein HHO41_13685 [Bacillus sp. DNRA2]|uniref:hypothetical protein n=1 Tax=Bacillus sp. DNRA2 TaxID=2723053 RepID=UPI00145D6706|nr:hypothetical protein [Bacillus sp. DNRA2]NMD71351.1 hypothetical protein [Bacillus sp. DNRA2]
MSLEEPQPQDVIIEINQIKVAFAANIEEYTRDLVFDYIPESGSFTLLGGSSC